MSSGKNLFEDVSAAIQSQQPRFLGIYSRGVEGILHTRTLHKAGERVFLWTARFAVVDPEEQKALLNRLSFFAESGVLSLPVIDLGIDAKGVAFLLTQWKEVETVAKASKEPGLAPDLFRQMVTLVSILHSNGMPFGDISEDSFLFDPAAARVGLTGLPGFGFPLPQEQSRREYLPPEKVAENEVPFERDIYGLGVYAHTLFAGSPFPRPVSKKDLDAYVADRLPELLESRGEDVPPWGGAVLGGMLRWDPKERIRIAELEELIGAKKSIFGAVGRFFRGLTDIGFSILNPRNIRLGTAGAVTLVAGIVGLVSYFFLIPLIAPKGGARATKDLEPWKISGLVIEKNEPAEFLSDPTANRPPAPPPPPPRNEKSDDAAPPIAFIAKGDVVQVRREPAPHHPSGLPPCKELRSLELFRYLSEMYRTVEFGRCGLDEE